MAVTSSELNYFYNAMVVGNTSSNGGRINLASRIRSGVAEALFSHTLEDERASGSTVYRKLFPLVANDDDLPLLAAGLWLDSPTPADDRIRLIAGTQRNTQAELTGSERRYGAARLKNDVAAGETSITVTVKDESDLGMFADADKIKLTKNTGILTVANTETALISGAPSVADLDITFGLTAGLTNDYAVADNARACSVYQPGDVKTVVDNVAATGLVYTANSLIGDNLGTIEQTWTFEGASASTFSCVGDTVGGLPAGAITAEYKPLNPINNKPYFTLPAGAITAIAAGNTLVAQTHPAAPPIWLIRDVPDGCAIFDGLNKIKLRYFGES